jgi:hypothetical protein
VASAVDGNSACRPLRLAGCVNDPESRWILGEQTVNLILPSVDYRVDFLFEEFQASFKSSIGLYHTRN